MNRVDYKRIRVEVAGESPQICIPIRVRKPIAAKCQTNGYDIPIQAQSREIPDPTQLFNRQS